MTVTSLQAGAARARAPAHGAELAGVPPRPAHVVAGGMARHAGVLPVGRAARALRGVAVAAGAGRAQPVLAGGLADEAGGARVVAVGAPLQERHPPHPPQLLRGGGVVRLALPRLHAAVEGLQRQLALQVPDDLSLSLPRASSVHFSKNVVEGAGMDTHLAHSWAGAGRVAHGGGGAGDEPLHLVGVVVGLQPWVDELHGELPVQSFRQQRPCPRDQSLVVFVGLVGQDRSLAGDDLQKHDAEGEDVGPVGYFPGVGVLRRHVPESPHHPRRNMAIVSVLDLGQPKVGDLGLKVVIEKDVGRLDVAMDDLRMTVLVQVCQALGRPERDPPPALPVQQRRSVAGVVQVGLERVVGDVLVDEQPLVAMDAVPQQRDEVAVVHAADALHLGAELALALPAAGPEPLDGHLPRRRARAQRAAVHVPEPALPQQLGVREPVRRRRQVRVRHRAARDRRVRGRLVGGRGAAAALPRADRCVWRWWWRVHWRYG
uniref:Uncharacterized protein n=1 Tax=Aegilops tauschii subsp. strangulata TaxID=200361 RepID=A0A452ZK32_AEGTS